MEIALGLTNNLPFLKRKVPKALTYQDLELDIYVIGAIAFSLAIKQKLDEADTIHFNLQEMRGISYVINTEGVVPLGSTNWELRTVWNDPVLRSKARFYDYIVRRGRGRLEEVSAAYIATQ